MRFLNEQAQLFMVAAVCMLIGVGALYVALGVWGMCVDKALRWFGVHAALMEYIRKQVRRQPWWQRVGTWYGRTFWGER